MPKNRDIDSAARRFGTFGGVFTPCTLTILGFEPPLPEKELVFHEVMERFAGELPRVLMVCSAGGMQLES